MLLLGYAAWMRGGAYVPLQGPLPWLGGMLMVMLFAFPVLSRGERRAADVLASHLRRLFTDPIFYLGLTFLALLWLQMWNAGRAQIFDETTARWTYSPPPHPGWPSAVTRAEAAEMLRWFFPAWALLLVLRSRMIMFRGARGLYIAMGINAGALALVGLKNYTPIMPHGDGGSSAVIAPFASFDYANHAASFFVLLLLLGLGLLLHELVGRGRRRKRWGRITLLSAAAFLTLAGANLSLSRAGMLSWVAILIAVAYAILGSWRQQDPATRLNVVMACVGVICLCYFFVDGFGKQGFALEAGRLVQLKPEGELEARSFQARAALRIWRDYPWVGVGGWGYRYLVGTYLTPDQWSRLGIGDANVHNDPVQFLAEFGALGGGLLAACVIVLLAPVARKGILTHPLALFPLLGVGWTFGHSLVDLPFRCPAILYHWLTILACLPLLLRHPNSTSPSAGKPAGAMIEREGTVRPPKAGRMALTGNAEGPRNIRQSGI